jgi:hypothetical protein
LQEEMVIEMGAQSSIQRVFDHEASWRRDNQVGHRGF